MKYTLSKSVYISRKKNQDINLIVLERDDVMYRFTKLTAAVLEEIENGPRTRDALLKFLIEKHTLTAEKAEKNLDQLLAKLIELEIIIAS